MYLLDKLAPSKKGFSFIKLFYVAISCLIIGILLSNLYSLQILHGNENLEQAVENTYSKKIVQAPRGGIFDKNLKSLAQNETYYAISLDLSKLKGGDLDEILEQIGKVDGLENEDIKARIEEGKGKDTIEILDRITKEHFDQLVDVLAEFASVTFLEKSIRKYNYGEISSHVIGYIGEANESEIENEGLQPHSYIGKDGIERFYDRYLRGRDGEIINIKRLDGSLDTFKTASEEPGARVVLTIDIVWQKYLYEILKNSIKEEKIFGGSAVIMESDTGKVISMVSYPSYDSNLFSQGIGITEFNSLIDDPRTPLLNRSIAIQAAPGSTFKPLIATAALGHDVVNPEVYYYSAGCEKIDETHTFCEADGRVLGDVNMYTGIARSSNLYFCHIGKEFNKKFGFENGIQYIVEYTDRFGIGEETGIDLWGEVPGNMSTPEYIQKTQDRDWYVGDMCNTVIGQGAVSVTPIRMVVAIASLVNGGNVMRPYLVEKIENTSGNIVYENFSEKKHTLELTPEELQVINDGMRKAVTDSQGSARYLNSIEGGFRAKTGSADASERLNNGEIIDGAHSWVVGTFTYNGTDYSFVVFRQYGGRGYKSVPIVGDFVRCLYSDFKDGCY
ncbi:hypothetical protein GF362_00125 [Candidatus Dojkabacteria bacterium]|nr:hypothetical protein [Candidatus Dojkabacteria bacterium]